jgi:hypothetical protein
MTRQESQTAARTVLLLIEGARNYSVSPIVAVQQPFNQKAEAIILAAQTLKPDRLMDGLCKILYRKDSKRYRYRQLSLGLLSPLWWPSTNLQLSLNSDYSLPTYISAAREPKTNWWNLKTD